MEGTSTSNIVNHSRTLRLSCIRQQARLLCNQKDGNIGRRIILPSSYTGSPRDMYNRYQDAMAIVRRYGKPDLFITITCNTNWLEITQELLPGQKAQDRPDVTTRVFRSKLEELKHDLFVRGVLGKVIAHVHVIEFQKRGLPHSHLLLILEESDKLLSDNYDSLVRI
ncbi:hypothetical protein Syun_007067 [Stephania yunnanensis]|uniref:Helitron helicase-like domain-containing protein n=1 Tax=Stephania yunnanensis TaxID=152371 RepID=A0AAP0KY50_9MAGN